MAGRDPIDVPAVHTVRGLFYRCVSRKRDPLSPEGARLRGGRYNRAGDTALYLADDPLLAVEESLQRALEFDVPRFNPRLLVTTEVSFAAILDLMDPRTRELLGVTVNDLVARGSDGALELTRAIGEQARAEGLEGVLAPSACSHGRANLVIFPENRRAASQLSVVGMDDHFRDEGSAS